MSVLGPAVVTEPEARPPALVVAAALVRVALIAGSFDIGENIIFNAFRHITPAMVFRYIAAGALGPQMAVAWGWRAVLTYVVLPLSRLPGHGPAPLAGRISLVLASLFCIGYAIAFFTGRDAVLADLHRH